MTKFNFRPGRYHWLRRRQRAVAATATATASVCVYYLQNIICCQASNAIENPSCKPAHFLFACFLFCFLFCVLCLSFVVCFCVYSRSKINERTTRNTHLLSHPRAHLAVIRLSAGSGTHVFGAASGVRFPFQVFKPLASVLAAVPGSRLHLELAKCASWV